MAKAKGANIAANSEWADRIRQAYMNNLVTIPSNVGTSYRPVWQVNAMPHPSNPLNIQHDEGVNELLFYRPPYGSNPNQGHIPIDPIYPDSLSQAYYDPTVRRTRRNPINFNGRKF